MPIQYPHHVSSLPFRISCLFRISSLGFRISPDLSGGIMRNEPNPSPAQDPKMRNEPNSHKPTANRQRPTAKKRETNPIPTPAITQNKPNSRTAAILSPFPAPIMRNEPNLHLPQLGQRSKYAKRTQSQPRRTCGGPKIRNEPNFTLPHAKYAKRTQSQPQRTCGSQKMRNEPNFRPAGCPNYAKRTQFHKGNSQSPTAKKCKTNPIYVWASATPGPGPHYAKRTQLPPTPARTTTQIRETNPIPVYQVSHHPLFWRNEPNLRLPQPRQGPKNAKRTQFPTQAGNLPYGHGMPCPKYAKQTQS